MDIQKKQATWNQERPLFELNFMHSHLLEYFSFNESTGDYELVEVTPDFVARDVVYEVLNTGWAMWLRAKCNAKSQAVPEGFVLVPNDQFESLSMFKDLYKRAIISARKRKDQLNWAHVAGLGVGSGRAVELCKMLNIDPGATNMHEVIEAQEQSHE